MKILYIYLRCVDVEPIRRSRTVGAMYTMLYTVVVVLFGEGWNCSRSYASTRYMELFPSSARGHQVCAHEVREGSSGSEGAREGGGEGYFVRR